MKISQNEIAGIELLGMLDGQEIQLVKTKGGLNLAVGRDRKGIETVLSAASHPAILSYNMEKNHPGFHSALLKSEKLDTGNADKHSHFLSDDLRKSGHDIYSVQTGDVVDFYVTHHNFKLEKTSGEFKGKELVMSSIGLKMGSPFLSPMVSAIAEKALLKGIKKVGVQK